MNKLVKSPTSDKHLMKDEAEGLVRLFPLARLSSCVHNALQEDQDERATQNLFAIFQLHMLRGVYGLLQSQVNGFQMAFPVKMERKDDYHTVIWVGECDSCGLGDFESFKAITKWKENERPGYIAIEVQVHPTAWNSSSCGNDAIRAIINHINPSIFNEVFRSFFKALGVFEICPKREFSGDDDYFGCHPKNCDFCRNEGQVSTYRIITECRPQFPPAEWFGTATGFFNYGR